MRKYSALEISLRLEQVPKPTEVNACRVLIFRPTHPVCYSLQHMGDSSFGKGFKITLGIVAALAVIFIALPAGCTACLLVLG